MKGPRHCQQDSLSQWLNLHSFGHGWRFVSSFCTLLFSTSTFDQKMSMTTTKNDKERHRCCSCYLFRMLFTGLPIVDSFHCVHDAGDKATVKVCSTSVGFADLNDLFDEAGRHKWISSLAVIRITIFVLLCIVKYIAPNHVFTGSPAEHPLSCCGENLLRVDASRRSLAQTVAGGERNPLLQPMHARLLHQPFRDDTLAFGRL
jgi:hypothetical protein